MKFKIKKIAEKKNIKRILTYLRRPLVLFFVILSLAIILFLFSLVRVYMRSDITLHEPSSGIFWYPALWISPFSFISYEEVARDVLAIQSHYNNQDFSSAGFRVDFSTEEGKKRLKLREKELLNILIEQKAFQRIVQDADLRVTDQEVNDSVERKLSEFGTKENVKETLNRLYGWNLDDFKNYIVKNEIYREKAKFVFSKKTDHETDKEAKKTIEKVKAELDSGEDFAVLAEKYSEGVTSKNGGRFGWLLLGEIMEPSVAKAIISMEAGSTSSIIESDLGYHIVKVHDSKKDSSGILYDISQIFIKKMTFSQWIEDYIKALNVKVFLKGYTWEASEGLVVFSDENMKTFELNLLNNQQIPKNESEDVKKESEKK
ncbi:MAG: peptidylprolyl isomerase [Candidatus Moraniibacteriota bacterium]|nr:MAG: peptidylprolyl isomerase [Candidatus Moranbacteria bacterium]